MGLSLLIVLVAVFSVSSPRELTEEDYANAIPGHLEYDPEFRKLHPYIPAPGSHMDSRIVGGEEAIPNSRPYQVAIYTPVGAGNSFCGGSLINARTVLTAAHCVDNRVGNVTMFLGAHNMPPAATDLNVTAVSSGDILIHPQWNRSRILHDVALIRFDTPIPLGVNIAPVLLPRESSQYYLGNTTLVSGWGRPSDDVWAISPVLREVTSFVISNFACGIAYLDIIEESHICTSGAHGRGTCQGDSGGPLVVNGVQVGIVSFGSAWGCAQGWPPAFARVTFYLGWIRANMAVV